MVHEPRLRSGPPRIERHDAAGPRRDADAASLAFDRFYREEYHRTLRTVVALRGRVTVAEEVTQEAFLTAFRQWEQIRAADDPAAWVRRVAVNTATSRWRRLGAETRALARLRSRRMAAATELPTPSGGFWEAVHTLPHRQAQAVALYYGADLAVADVAQAMRCAEGTVKSHLHAARTQLATLLDAEEEP